MSVRIPIVMQIPYFDLYSVEALAAWVWLASCLTASLVWCSVALQLLWPVPLGILAGVFRMSPAYQCQVRPREGGRRAEDKKTKQMLGVDMGATRLMLGVFQGWSTVA